MLWSSIRVKIDQRASTDKEKTKILLIKPWLVMIRIMTNLTSQWTRCGWIKETAEILIKTIFQWVDQIATIQAHFWVFHKIRWTHRWEISKIVVLEKAKTFQHNRFNYLEGEKYKKVILKEKQVIWAVEYFQTSQLMILIAMNCALFRNIGMM